MRNLLFAGALAASLAFPRHSVFAQPVRPLVGREHQIQTVPGENLYTLGVRYGLAIEHFAFANRIPIQLDVPAGKKLIVPAARVLPSNPPTDGLVVNLPERGVFLFRRGQFEKFYPIAIGQPGRFATPMGSTSIVARVKDPTWMPPEWAGMGNETIVPAGPNNPLGDRWIGLGLPGVGLHSTLEPASIGAAASHGCMRMYPDSVRELFEKVEIGMPVRIEYEPVKVGRDENGSLFAVVFPDVYDKVNLEEELRRKLDEAGAAGLVADEQIERWVKLASGTPQKVADADIAINVDGLPAETQGGAILSNGSLHVSGEVLRRAGFEVNYDSLTKLLSVSKNGKQTLYSLSDDSDSSYLDGTLLHGMMLGGKAYVPARTLSDQFGYPVQWDGKNRTVSLGP